MSKIEQLIQQYCPDGVEWVKLEEVAQVGTGSSNGNEADENGLYPFYVRSQSIKRKNNYEYDEEAIIIPGEGGIGDIFHYVNGKYALHQRVYRIHFTLQCLNVKFVFYYMQCAFKQFILKKAVSATVTSIRKPMIESFSIPLPPLPVQEEIVRILDTFSELQAKLQTELQARQQQYQYYRDKLLSFEGRDDVEWKKLGEVADLLSGFPFNSTQFTSSGIRLMRGVNIKRGQLCFNNTDDRFWKSIEGLDKYIVNENDIVISMDGSLVGKSFGMVKKEHLPLLLVQRVARIRSSVVNINYIYHCINNWFPTYVHKKKTQGAIPHISMKDIANFTIPVPSIKEQERIATILDRFDTLVNDLSQGLPAEIEARKQQYEYYRDKLLSFKKKA